MKLILCTFCQDVVKLDYDVRTCDCTRTAGKYKEDGWHALVSDNAVVLGVSNRQLMNAIRAHKDCPPGEMGPEFQAWVFPQDGGPQLHTHRTRAPESHTIG